MNIEQLILAVRSDYLDDNPQGNLWDDAFMFRAFTEAERQVCNRQNILFDDSTDEYTKLVLVDGQSTYALSPKVTKLEAVIFDNTLVAHKSKHEIERLNPKWRSLSGMTGKAIEYVIRGSTIRFIPSPNIDDAGLAVNLEVYRLPDVALDGLASEPEIPEEFHRDLIYWVLHEAYKKQDSDMFNQERSDYFLGRFTEVFGEYISAEVRLNQNQQRKSLHLRPTKYTTKMSTSSDDDWD